MQNDERRVEALREIDGLECLFNRAFALLRVRGGEFVAIGRGLHDFDREWTEVVQAAEFDFAGVEHFLDTRHERDANAVAQLDAIEAEVLYFTEHLIARGVAA